MSYWRLNELEVLWLFWKKFKRLIAWKQWRMCPGRKWRIEDVSLGRGHQRRNGGAESAPRCGGQRAPCGTWIGSGDPVFSKKWDHLLGCGKSASCPGYGVFGTVPIPVFCQEGPVPSGTISSWPSPAPAGFGRPPALHTVYCQWRTVSCLSVNNNYCMSSCSILRIMHIFEILKLNYTT